MFKVARIAHSLGTNEFTRILETGRGEAVGWGNATNWKVAGFIRDGVIEIFL